MMKFAGNRVFGLAVATVLGLGAMTGLTTSAAMAQSAKAMALSGDDADQGYWDGVDQGHDDVGGWGGSMGGSDPFAGMEGTEDGDSPAQVGGIDPSEGGVDLPDLSPAPGLTGPSLEVVAQWNGPDQPAGQAASSSGGNGAPSGYIIQYIDGVPVAVMR